MLDAIDVAVLQALADRGRITWSELGGIVGLSPPAAAERVHKLELRGVIRGYSTLLDPRAVGCTLTAFIAVSLERPRYRAAFLKLVSQIPQIQECHHVAGDCDYLLKVRCRDTHELETLISDVLKSLTGVSQTRTTVVLSTVKETPRLPLGDHADEAGKGPRK